MSSHRLINPDPHAFPNKRPFPAQPNPTNFRGQNPWGWRRSWWWRHPGGCSGPGSTQAWSRLRSLPVTPLANMKMGKIRWVKYLELRALASRLVLDKTPRSCWSIYELYLQVPRDKLITLTIVFSIVRAMSLSCGTCNIPGLRMTQIFSEVKLFCFAHINLGVEGFYGSHEKTRASNG